MAEPNTDLILTNGVYALFRDNTKGVVSTVAGPMNISRSGNETPVVWDAQGRMFVETDFRSVVRQYVTARRNEYVVLHNPAVNDRQPHPSPGSKQAAADLRVGEDVVIPGPCTFALWPGQSAEVIPGHALRSNQFLIVEVDSTYYGLPSERNAALWVERTSEEFLFDIKAFALFTHHPTPLASLPKDVREALPSALHSKKNVYYKDLPPEFRNDLWGRFASALLPLDSAGKLGVVLLQFPPWFMPSRESKDYILEAQERLPQYRVAVEFRNNLWLTERNRERTLRFLAEHVV